MKRWGFKGLRATHGVTKAHRAAGNTGGKKDGHWKGTKLAGFMGGRSSILRGVEVNLFPKSFLMIQTLKHNPTSTSMGLKPLALKCETIKFYYFSTEVIEGLIQVRDLISNSCRHCIYIITCVYKAKHNAINIHTYST